MKRATLVTIACLLASFLATGCESQRTDSTNSPPATSPAAAREQSPTVTGSGNPGIPAQTERPGTEQASDPAEHPISKSTPEKTVREETLDPTVSASRTLAIAPRVMELPTEALSVWRNFTKQKPVLVLMSNTPLLQPIPEELATAALSLAGSGSALDLRRKGTSLTADPLLLPGMALTAALRAGFFSQVIWVIPTQVDSGQLKREIFREQLIEIGAASPAEAEAFVLEQGVFSGKLLGVPFLAAPQNFLPSVQGIVLLHIDLSYFQPRYKGEIKTPLYPLLAETFDALKKTGWQVAAATISLSNLEGGVPLTSRFVGHAFAAFFIDPLLPQKPMPDNWARRANALYLENFFQKEKVREMYLEMEKEAPADPSVKYALYAVARQFNEGDKALAYLRQAVRLDPVYALEYLSLADLAEEKGLTAQALRMLAAAAAALPDNPFITLHMAETMLRLEQFTEAAQLARTLAGQNWSQVYYPQMPGILQELTSAASGAGKSDPENR